MYVKFNANICSVCLLKSWQQEIAGHTKSINIQADDAEIYNWIIFHLFRFIEFSLIIDLRKYLLIYLCQKDGQYRKIIKSTHAQRIFSSFSILTSQRLIHCKCFFIFLLANYTKQKYFLEILNEKSVKRRKTWKL